MRAVAVAAAFKRELRQGQNHSASITATGRVTDPESQAELEEDLGPGENAMEMRVDYTVEGVPPKEISTPVGTFTDVSAFPSSSTNRSSQRECGGAP